MSLEECQTKSFGINLLLHANNRIRCGVPQGSVISPLLFPIYINDITKASSFHTTLFADDINLHMSNSCCNVLQTTVNLELCEIDHWLIANELSLNHNDTNFMLSTSRKHNPASFEFIINNRKISPEHNLKYLGVLLDNKLSWKSCAKGKNSPIRSLWNSFQT